MKSTNTKLVSTPTSDQWASPRRKVANFDMDGGFGDYIELNSCSIEIENPIAAMENKYEEYVTSPLARYLLMAISVFGISAGHIFSKIAYTHNTNLTNVDWLFFSGLMLTIVYFIWAKASHTPMTLKEHAPKTLIYLLVCFLLAVGSQLFLFQGISMIPVGKSTLIFSTSSMFAVILGSFILNEKATVSVVFSTIGAFVGIYFLSRNDEDFTDEEESLILGIILVLTGSILQAVVFVIMRIISNHKIDAKIIPFYVGMFFIFVGGVTTSVLPSMFNIKNYTPIDVLILICVGIGAWFCFIPLSILSKNARTETFVTYKYENPSRLCQILYIENIFCIIADIAIFDCKFIVSDYIGIGIIATCLLLPILLKIKR